MTPPLLDLRGLRCPWPAIRVARALREGGGALVAVADDPLAPGEIAAVAQAVGGRASAVPTAIGPGLLIVREDREFPGVSTKG